ncbi:MAG: hypothetical protein ACOYEO_06495 [bacterium]|jgi:hypothetical protein
MANGKEQPSVPTEYGLGQALNLLADQKELSPQLFLAALSLTNLLGIVDYLNHVQGPTQAMGSNRANPDKQALTSTLMSLLAADGSGDKKDALLSGLMSTLGTGGSGKKLDPATLLTLASSLAGSTEKNPTTPAKYASDQPSSANKGQADVQELKTRRG